MSFLFSSSSSSPNSNSLVPMTPHSASTVMSPSSSTQDPSSVWVNEWEELSLSELSLKQVLIDKFTIERLTKVITENMMIQFNRGYSKEIDPVSATIENLSKCIEWRENYQTGELIYNKDTILKEIRKVWE